MTYHLQCTTCKHKSSYTGVTFGDCRKSAQDSGWHITARKALCSSCEEVDE